MLRMQHSMYNERAAVHAYNAMYAMRLTLPRISRQNHLATAESPPPCCAETRGVIRR